MLEATRILDVVTRSKNRRLEATSLSRLETKNNLKRGRMMIDQDDSTVRLLNTKLTAESIQDFLSQLDDLDKEGFIQAASAITFELEERARYQAEKNDLDLEELLESIGC